MSVHAISGPFVEIIFYLYEAFYDDGAAFLKRRTRVHFSLVAKIIKANFKV